MAEVLVNRTTGHVVDGHLRVGLALARKEPTVPVTYVELSEDEERLVLATLDPLAAMAQAEKDQLTALLVGLEPDDDALRALLDDLGREAGIESIRAGLVDPDDVPDVPDEPTVQRGDLYLLGDHRLLCGDSTDSADVGRLVDGAEVDCLWTDPPYGVEYQTKLSREEATARHRRRDGLTIANDTSEAMRALLVSSLRLTPLRPGGAWYVASPSGDMESVFRRALYEAGLHLRQQLVWVKDVFVMGRQDYHWRHETVL